MCQSMRISRLANTLNHGLRKQLTQDKEGLWRELNFETDHPMPQQDAATAVSSNFTFDALKKKFRTSTPVVTFCQALFYRVVVLLPLSLVVELMVLYDVAHSCS